MAAIVTIESFKRTFGIHFTVNHNGKMEGMQSLSTSCKDNTICQKRSKDPNSICSHCYAQRMLKCWVNMQAPLKQNLDILTTRLFEVKEMPLLNTAFFRLESFGDLQNTVQLHNYFNLCKANPSVNFALWTKNYWIVDELINSGIIKPKNLNIVLSSPYINERMDCSKYDWADAVFTTFTKEYVKENQIKINCGNKKCLACQKCYKKHRKFQEINELVK